MQDVIIEDRDDRTILISPYDPACPKRARMIGGTWDPASRTWRFDRRDRQRVEQLAADLWGWKADDEGRTVTLRVNADDYNVGQEIIVAGRRVAWRPERDSPVRLAQGVVVTAGRFPDSGGSRKSPTIGRDCGVTLEIRDLPVGAIDKLTPGEFEIVERARETASQLEAEKARLEQRIRDIDRQLAEMGETK